MRRCLVLALIWLLLGAAAQAQLTATGVGGGFGASGAPPAGCTASTNIYTDYSPFGIWSAGDGTVTEVIPGLMGGNALKYAPAATSDKHFIQTSATTPTLNSGTTYTMTVYLVNSGSVYTVFGDVNGNNWLWGSIQWSNLAVTTSGTDSATIDAPVSLGSGMYCISLHWVRDATSTFFPEISSQNSSAATIGNNDLPAWTATTSDAFNFYAVTVGSP